MATGAFKLTIKGNITGLGEEINFGDDNVTMTVPVEVLTGYTIVEGATTISIALLAGITNIALAKVYGVYIKAEVGTIYILLQTDGTATVTAATADLVLNVGESCYLAYNGGKTGVAGIAVNASAATDAFSWAIVGEA